VTFEDTQRLAEEVRLVELFGLFGFDAANSNLVSLGMVEF
jgi:hypothetical protein